MADGWPEYLDAHWDAWVRDLGELLAIPSVSTDPAHAGDVLRAARWTGARLERAGIEGVRVLETPGHPIVYGEWLRAPGRPTVLVYGHYDVQPPDPLGSWTSPPFEPTLRGGRLYARGASDMKGNLLLPVAACEAMLRSTGALPLNVRFLYEGEEEVFSPSLEAFVATHRDMLGCDAAVSADGGQAGEDRPVVSIGARGLVGVEVGVRTAASDAHSGQAGGLLPSAAHILVRILGALRGPDERVLVPGFYDDVAEPTDTERAAIAAARDLPHEALRAAGARALVGEPGRDPVERNWVRPTLDINGMWSGFTGEGAKTIIPCEAHAKITCRLVPRQTPEAVLDLIEAHVRRLAPPEAEVTVRRLPGRSHPYRIPADAPPLAAARRVLGEVYGRAPAVVCAGGTVPALAILRKLLGVWTLPFGFGAPDEHIHAPDEFVRLQSLRRGQTAYGRLLEELGTALG